MREGIVIFTGVLMGMGGKSLISGSGADFTFTVEHVDAVEGLARISAKKPKWEPKNCESNYR